jgi:hypothetical protein
MTMTKRDIAVLLAMIAAYDQRTIGEADVEAWHAVAGAEEWTLPRARRAVIEHHRAGADKTRMRPAHISDAIRAVQDAARRSALNANPVAPRDVHPSLWFCGFVEDAKAAALDAWVNGETLPNWDDPNAVKRLIENRPHLRAIEDGAA